MIQSLTENWLVNSKMTRGIWQILFRTLARGDKLQRSYHFNDNEEWFKIWRGIDLSVQNWNEELDKFSPFHSKISKMCALMSCLWPNYKMFELIKCRGVILDDTKNWFKILRNADLCFQKWHEEFGKFSQPGK